MEILVALVIGFILYSFFSSNESPSDSSSSGQNTGSRNQKEPLYLKVSKDQDKKDGFTFFNVAAAGLLPNHYDMNLVGALYIYDEETKLPFVSNFDITNESEDSMVFRREVDLGFQNAGLYYPKFVNITNYALEAIQPPHKGSRSVKIVVFFFDADKPVIFNNGVITQNQDNLLHIAEIKKTFTYDEPGYMDEINNLNDCKPLMVDLAMQMAMSDGSLDKTEGIVIKNWIKQEIKMASDSQKDDLKKSLNATLESSYKRISSKGNDDSILQEFNKKASRHIKYQLIEFCLDVLSADGVASEGELKKLESMTKKMGLNYDEVQKMKDKTLVKIVSDSSSSGKPTSDESIVGLDKNLSNEDALKFIKKEYRKWNGRLNSLNPGNERDNAQRLLDTLARLRKKYEEK